MLWCGFGRGGRRAAVDAGVGCVAVAGGPGYRIYFGTNTRNYQFVTNAGLVLTQSVVLPHGGRWFFAATAVDTNGLESDFSNEVQWESKPVAPVMTGEPWVRLLPELGQSTNQVDWGSLKGEATWFPATNGTELFR